MLIEAKGLEKSFPLGDGQAQIIKGIDLSIDRGEFVVIMGPSGSGKTTLLYLLSGLEKKTKGELKLFDKEIETYNDKALSDLRKTKIGFVFQFYNLIPNLTVYENVKLAARIAKNQADPMIYLEKVGLKEYKDYLPDSLSGGMRQRVAIARALINNPDIIFADEPIGALDSKMGQEIMELFKKINEEDMKTIIMVTHLEDNARYASRVIYIRDGVIEKEEKVI